MSLILLYIILKKKKFAYILVIPKSKSNFEENDFGISFNMLVRPKFDEIENSKKIEFYIKKTY